MDGFSQGITMRNSDTLSSLRYSRQEKIERGDEIEVITYLNSDRGYCCEHHLRYCQGDEALTFFTTVRNDGSEKFGLEMLASFSLGGITPFAADDASGRLHRSSVSQFLVCGGTPYLSANRGTSPGAILVRVWCSSRTIRTGRFDARSWLSSICSHRRPRCGRFLGRHFSLARIMANGAVSPG